MSQRRRGVALAPCEAAVLRSASAGRTRPGPPGPAWLVVTVQALVLFCLRSWLALVRIACPVHTEGEFRAESVSGNRVEALLLLAELPSGIPPLWRPCIQAWPARGPDLQMRNQRTCVINPISHLGSSRACTIQWRHSFVCGLARKQTMHDAADRHSLWHRSLGSFTLFFTRQ